MSDAERLTRIETMLNVLVTVMRQVDTRLDGLEKDLSADRAELAAWKNKGTGVLVGVGLAAATLGASASTLWQWLIGIVK